MEHRTEQEAAYNYWQDVWKREQDFDDMELAEEAAAIRAEQADASAELAAIIAAENGEQ